MHYYILMSMNNNGHIDYNLKKSIVHINSNCI